MGHLITVVSYRDLSMAGLAKSRLEADGIDCFLSNEHHVAVNWLYSIALGGVKVQVMKEDVERALEILGEEAALEPAPQEDTSFADTKDDTCTRCGSSNIGVVQTSTWAGVTSVLFGIILLGLPFIFFRKNYRCADCGHVMK